MIVNISYPLAALHEASRFIWETNPYVLNWPTTPTSVFDVMSSIKSMMEKGAMDNARLIVKERFLKINLDNEWIDYTGTGGYYIIYSLRDENETTITIDADILVDPAVGNPDKGYITEYVDEIVET
jgi:hypothetical protein